METKTKKRIMLYVEFPLAQSLQEAIQCMKDGGELWQEDSDDFPNCGGFDTIEDLLEDYPAEEYQEDLNFVDALIHLVPKDEKDKIAEPFEIGETVYATERQFIDNNRYVLEGDCYTITDINGKGDLGLDKDKVDSIWWDATKFCRCILPVIREKVYILANMTSSSVGYDLDNVYKDIKFLKEECGKNIIWSNSIDDVDDFIDYMKRLGFDICSTNWDITGYAKDTGELLFAIQECFLRTQ